MRFLFDRCREAVSAEDAARRYGIQINHQGKAVCPFHNDHHPSMTFRDGKYHCWACGAAGDSIDFTARLLGLEMPVNDSTNRMLSRANEAAGYGGNNLRSMW